MKKSLSILLLLSILVMGMVPAMASAASKPATGKLIVYTSVPTAQLDLMTSMFNAKYPGISVDVFSADSAEVKNRAQAEAGAPQGDLLLGGGLEDYRQVEDLLSAYEVPHAKEFHQDFMAQSAIFTPIQLHVSAIVINNELAKELGVAVDSWGSLKNDKLTGRVLYMNPAASSPDMQQSAFVNDFVGSVEGASVGAPSFVLNAVTAGQYLVGIINEEKAIERRLQGADLSIVYAQEGAAMGASYAGILKGAANESNAQLFMDFITSREYQQAAADQLHQRSIRGDVSFGIKGIAASHDLHRADYAKLVFTWLADAGVLGMN